MDATVLLCQSINFPTENLFDSSSDVTTTLLRMLLN